ncbi:MAG: hypothetical protein ACRC12_04075, partial [Holosporales bacterium]
MASLARLKQIIKAIAPAPVWRSLRRVNFSFRYHLGRIVSRFPFVLSYLPQKFAQELLFIGLERSLWLNDRKRINKIKKETNKMKKELCLDYGNALLLNNIDFFREKTTDEKLIQINLELSTYIALNPPGTIDIYTTRGIASSKKTKILHLVSWFSTESSLLSMLDCFFSCSDRGNFSHIAFTTSFITKECHSFFKKYNINIIQKSTLETPIECDIVLDWDGFAGPHVLKFLEGRRPFVLSCLND